MNKLRVLGLICFFLLMLGSANAKLQAAVDTNNLPSDYQPTWTAGHTSVSDLSHEEKQKLLGYKVPDWYHQWWESLPKLEAPKGATFDPVFDWRTHIGPYGTNGVTPVKNQASCGSCWAFAAVGELESMVKIYGEVELDLSEQQCVSCLTPNSGCDGYYSEACFDLFRTKGAIKEECMPYKAIDTEPCIQNQCQKWAKLSGYIAISNNVNSIKQALFNGPVKSGMAVEDTFYSYTGGCYNKPFFEPNHAVLIVGWDDNMCGSGQGAWIVKNSWGPGFGVNGYYYIKYGCCMIGSDATQVNYIFHRPMVRLISYGINDQTGGDGDGRAEAGETVRLDFSLKNLWSALGNVRVTVSADTAGLVISDNLSSLGNMASKDLKNNALDPMQFQVPVDFPPRRISFTFHVAGDSGSGVTYQADTTVTVLIGRDILLVDDDQGSAGGGTNLENYYIGAFDSLKSVYDIWDKNSGQDTFDLPDYDVVIWYTGDHRDSVFSPTDIQNLKTYLDQGGRLFLTSQDVVEVLAASTDPLDTLFLRDYLHVSYGGDNFRHFVSGEPGDVVGDTLWIYPESTPGANNQSSKDNLIPDSLADVVLFYADNNFGLTDSVAAIKYQGDYKLVFFGFGFEGINQGGGYFHGEWLSQPVVVMERVLDWLRTSWQYKPGDANGDQNVDVGDVVFLVNYLFKSGIAPSYMSSGDANGDCKVDVGDVVFLVNYLFKNGAVPVEGCAK